MDEELLTRQQQKALHKYFDMVAKALTDAGLDMRRTLKPSIDIPWTGKNVKTFLWKPLQDFQLGKKSTTELLKKNEITPVYDTLNRWLGEKHGIHEPFPSIEQLMIQDLTE